MNNRRWFVVSMNYSDGHRSTIWSIESTERWTTFRSHANTYTRIYATLIACFNHLTNGFLEKYSKRKQWENNINFLLLEFSSGLSTTIHGFEISQRWRIRDDRSYFAINKSKPKFRSDSCLTALTERTSWELIQPHWLIHAFNYHNSIEAT